MVQEAFQRVRSDFEDLPKSVMFKTMGYSPGFLLKNVEFSTLANSPEINTNSRTRSQKLIQKGIGGVPESLEGFRGLTKIGHFQNHGLQPRLFAQKRPNFDPCEFTRNQHKQSRKELAITLEWYRRRSRKFGRISRTYQNRSFSKPWAIVQAFCSKTSNFRPLRIQPKSTQTVAQGVRNSFRKVQEAFPKVWRDFEDLPKSVIFKTMGYSPGFLLKNGQFSTLANCPAIDTNSGARSQKLLQKGIGGVSESLEGFRGLTKIGHFQNHGLQPRLFAQKRPIFDPCELSRNRHKQWLKELDIILEGYRMRFRELEAISRTYQNRSCKKTMGYSSGFLLKNGQFSTLANCPAIDTNSGARSQKSLQKGIGGVPESLEGFRGLTKIGHFQNHGLWPRLFAEKRPIFDPCEFTRNQHKQWRKELEITLEGYRRRSRKFGGISRTYQNRSFSKPWAMAQAFC